MGTLYQAKKILMDLSNSPIVSIVCITYNQEFFIAQAIEGFLMQKTTFPFEIIVHDDASTDNTTGIIKEYEAKYPYLFSNIYQTENQFSKPNGDVAKIVFSAAQGKYIAICEGDDYWIDPHKLQTQVDFLESNPDYGMVYSKVKVYIEKDKQFKKRRFGRSISSFEDLLMGNHISTPTVLFRKEIYFSYLEAIQPDKQNWLMGDYPLWIYIASVSKIKYLDYPSSVYRILENSVAHSPDYMKEISFLESYHAIKLFYVKKLGFSHLEEKIWERLFLGKAYIYLFKNEENVSELVKEINEYNIRSFKISIIKFIISNWFLRKMLKFYWLRRAK